MRETIRVVPAVEIRQTFSPSQPFCELLQELIAKEHDDEMKSRLVAGLLFRSYRRRVMSVEEYVRGERERRGVLHNANHRFQLMASMHIPIEAVTTYGADERSKRDRVRIGLKMTRALLGANVILSDIPTIEATTPEMLRPAYGRAAFAILPKQSLYPESLTSNFVHSKVNRELAKDKDREYPYYYVQPERIVNRETIIPEDQLTSFDRVENGQE